jgi:hypothetical protein
VLPEHDTLMFQLCEQYRLLSTKELNKAWNKREFSDHVNMPFDEFLKLDGAIGERELQFVQQKDFQLRTGKAGTRIGYSVGELGIAKGYVHREAFIQLVRRQDAPTREDGESAIAAHLFNHRALRFYQVIDLLEGCGILLMACPNCREQVQVDHFEGDTDYPCPICWQPLVPLTIPPGRRPRMVQIPPIEDLHVFRIAANELPEVG